jgi:LysM repeat protein
VDPRWRLQLARVGAPAAFLLAATLAILLVRSALDDGDGAEPVTTRSVLTTAPTTVPIITRPATTQPSPIATTAEAGEFYEIQQGDTLASVADQYGTTVEELLTLNPDVDPASLTIGQRIRVQ